MTTVYVVIYGCLPAYDDPSDLSGINTKTFMNLNDIMDEFEFDIVPNIDVSYSTELWDFIKIYNTTLYIKS